MKSFHKCAYSFFLVCRLHNHIQLFIHTQVKHVILCVESNLLAFTELTSYNQIFVIYG